MRVRWDWVVVLVGAVLLALLAAWVHGLIGFAVAGGYCLGRWDAHVGVKYRERADGWK